MSDIKEVRDPRILARSFATSKSWSCQQAGQSIEMELTSQTGELHVWFMSEELARSLSKQLVRVAPEASGLRD